MTKETDGDITYTSSNPEVATVDTKSGKVTGVSAGTAIITATSEETVAYQEGAASYSLTVIEPDSEPTGIPAVFNFAEPRTLNPQFSKDDFIGEHNYILVNNVTFDEGPIKLIGIDTKSGGLNRLYYDTSSDPNGLWSYRMSTKTSMTISCTDNHHRLVCIVFEPSGNTYAQHLASATFSPGTYDEKTQTLTLGSNDNKSVTITPNSTLRFSKITAYYTSSSTGINDIAIIDNDNTPVEYYNLQGVRVTSPTPGLYIRVQGKQATKVYLK